MMKQDIENPWLGLKTYSEGHILYGRERESKEVVNIVMNNRTTVLYGKSGIGKSSLLKAGVFPQLRYWDYIPLYMRLSHNTNMSYMQQIKQEILTLAAENDTLEMRLNGNLSDETCEDETTSLSEIFNKVSFYEKQTGFNKYVFIVFDQFEEMFTLPDKEHAGQVASFFSSLAELLNNISHVKNHFRLLFCLRDDSLYFLEHYSFNIPTLKYNRYCLNPLDRTAGREVITGPVPDLVSPEVCEAILDKVMLRKSDFVEPAILSLFLHELYEKSQGNITLDNVQNYGEHLLSDFYEEGVSKFPESSVAYLEDNLLTQEGFRQALSLYDVKRYVKEEDIALLIEKRILTVNEDIRGYETIELAHDVLCPIIEKRREDRTHRKEAQLLAEKARKARKRLVVSSIISLASLVGIILLGFLFYQLNEQKLHILANQSRYVSHTALRLASDGNIQQSLALLKEVIPNDQDQSSRPFTNEVYNAIIQVKENNSRLKSIFQITQNESYTPLFNRDGSRLLLSNQNNAFLYDTDTGDLLDTIYKRPDSLYYTINMWEAEHSLDGRVVAHTSVDNQLGVVRFAMTGDTICTYPLHSGEMTDLALSHDGKLLVFNVGDTLKLYETETGKFYDLQNAEDEYYNEFQFSPNDSLFISCSSSKFSNDVFSTVWRVSSVGNLPTKECRIDHASIQLISPDSKFLIAEHTDKTYRVWDLSLHKPVLKFRKCSNKDNKCYTFSSNGKQLAFVDQDNSIQLYDVPTIKKIRTIKGNVGTYKLLQFNADNNYLLGLTYEGMTAVWDLDYSEVEPYTFGDEELSVTHVEFEPAGNKLLMSTSNGIASILNMKNGKIVTVGDMYSISHPTKFYAMFTPDGNSVLTVANERNPILWDVREETNEFIYMHCRSISSAAISPQKDHVVFELGEENILLTLQGDTAQTEYVLNASDLSNYGFSPDGQKIFYSYYNDSLSVYDVTTGKKIQTFSTRKGFIKQAQFTEDGENIMINHNNSISLYDISTGQIQKSYKYPNDLWNGTFALSPDQESFVTVGKIFNQEFDSIENLVFWNMDTGEGRENNQSTNAPVIYSPHGQYVAMADGTDILVVDTKTLQTRWKFSGHIKPILDIQFSHDGSKMVSASSDQLAIVWDVEKGNEIARLIESDGEVCSAKFSPNDELILTLTSEGYVNLWNAKTGYKVCDVLGSGGEILAAEFSTDGKKILTVSKRGEIHLWKIPTQQELMEWMDKILNGYTLTPAEKRAFFVD